MGAVLLLIVRYVIHRRQRSEEDDEELAESIEKLKKELQQSGDTIIKRLGSHVTKLEGLLREADDRRVQLETRAAEAQRLEWALHQRIEELERRLSDMGQTLPPAIQPQRRAAVPVSPASSPQISGVLGGQVPPLVMQPTEAQRTDGDAFAAVLHQSILREQMRGGTPPAAPAPIPPPPAQASPSPRAVPPSVSSAVMPASAAPVQQMPPERMEQPAPPTEEEELPEDETIIKARALLRAGRTIEQVARETGVEIGALRLMKQMTQKD